MAEEAAAAPRDARQYAFGIPFLVNGSYTVKLLVVGEGCPARLELANLAQKHLTFGMVPEGQQVAKQVCVCVCVCVCVFFGVRCMVLCGGGGDARTETKRVVYF